MKTIKNLKAGDQVYFVYDNHEYRIGTILDIQELLGFIGKVYSYTFKLMPGGRKYTEVFQDYGSNLNKNHFYPDSMSGCVVYLEKNAAIKHIKDSIKTALKSIDELSAI